uniref:Uncharacterized protein n=1 Tax=Anguilla anguilla TaxID=7936 RepID=A0A0E9QE36_ANGAN
MCGARFELYRKPSDVFCVFSQPTVIGSVN